MLSKYYIRYDYKENYLPMKYILDNLAIFKNKYKNEMNEQFFYRYRNNNIIFKIYPPIYIELESYNQSILLEIANTLKNSH